MATTTYSELKSLSADELNALFSKVSTKVEDIRAAYRAAADREAADYLDTLNLINHVFRLRANE